MNVVGPSICCIVAIVLLVSDHAIDFTNPTRAVQICGIDERTPLKHRVVEFDLLRLDSQFRPAESVQADFDGLDGIPTIHDPHFRDQGRRISYPR